MQEFETRAVSELPVEASGKKTGLTATFRALPQGQAMLVPRKNPGRELSNLRNGWFSSLARAFLDRQIVSRVDREADGVWFWWEPRQ